MKVPAEKNMLSLFCSPIINTHVQIFLHYKFDERRKNTKLYNCIMFSVEYHSIQKSEKVC